MSSSPAWVVKEYLMEMDLAGRTDYLANCTQTWLQTLQADPYPLNWPVLRLFFLTGATAGLHMLSMGLASLPFSAKLWQGFLQLTTAYFRLPDLGRLEEANHAALQQLCTLLQDDWTRVSSP